MALLHCIFLFFGTLAVAVAFGILLRSYLIAKICKDRLAKTYKQTRYSVTQ